MFYLDLQPSSVYLSVSFYCVFPLAFFLSPLNYQIEFVFLITFFDSRDLLMKMSSAGRNLEKKSASEKLLYITKKLSHIFQHILSWFKTNTKISTH